MLYVALRLDNKPLIPPSTFELPLIDEIRVCDIVEWAISKMNSNITMKAGLLRTEFLEQDSITIISLFQSDTLSVTPRFRSPSTHHSYFQESDQNL